MDAPAQQTTDEAMAERSYVLAHELREKGEYAAALNLYRSYLAGLSPDRKKPLRKALIGAIHSANGLGDWRGMEAFARQLAERFPRLAEGPRYLGEALIRQRRHAEAAAALEQAIGLDPNLVEARALLAVAKESGGEPRTRSLKAWPARTGRFADLRGLINRYLLSGVPKGLAITGETSFMTLGSCFAENLALRLQRAGCKVFHEPIGEEINSTYANRYLLDWVERGAIDGPTRTIGEMLGPGARKRLHHAISDSDIFVLTLGVAPCFFHEGTGEFAFMVSQSSAGREFLTDRRVMRTTTVAENVDNVGRIVASVRRLSPRRPKIVLTVSPVPLTGTTEYGSAVIADAISKSTLRLACDQAMRELDDPDLHYWPSFEMVRWLGPHLGPEHPAVFGHDDGNSRHVSAWMVDLIMDLFLEHHAVQGRKFLQRGSSPE
jgi:hypothetical protein